MLLVPNRLTAQLSIHWFWLVRSRTTTLKFVISLGRKDIYQVNVFLSLENNITEIIRKF